MSYDEVVRFPEGTVAFVRMSGRRPRPKLCACGSVATLQCDYPLLAGATCDKFMCRACAGPRRADGTDYCQEHRP